MSDGTWISTLGQTLAPYYLYIKFFHVANVMAWALSTSHAFMFYLVPVFQQWRRHPSDPERIRMRNWAMERFDDGVIIEHVAFPLVLLSGLAMLATGGWTADSGWLVLKLCIVIALMIPIEICDYYLSHFGGNKAGLRQRGEHERYESMIQIHWLFFLITTPLVGIFVTLIVFLAIVKPF